MGVGFVIARLRDDAVIEGLAHRYDGWDLLAKVNNGDDGEEVVTLPIPDTDAVRYVGWSYTGFSRFRERLAALAGMDLQAEWRKLDARGDSYVCSDPALEPLLIHSDCEGIITADECARLAPRLRQLVENWPDDDYDKAHASGLAELLEAVAAEPSGHAVLMFT